MLWTNHSKDTLSSLIMLSDLCTICKSSELSPNTQCCGPVSTTSRLNESRISCLSVVYIIFLLLCKKPRLFTVTAVQVALPLNERDFLSLTTENARNVATSPQHLLKPASYSHHSSFLIIIFKRVKKPGLHQSTTRKEKTLRHTVQRNGTHALRSCV